MIVFAATLFVSQAHAGYTVTLAPESSTPIVFSLDLQPGHSNLLETRSQPSEVKNPRCGLKILEQKSPDAWIVPDNCRRVEWDIDFSPAPDNGVGGFMGNHSVAFSNWWSIMERTALLRQSGDESASEITIRQAGRKDFKSFVPSTRDASDFYVIGKIAELEQTVDGTRVTYATDDLNMAKRRGMISMHMEAYSKLHAMFKNLMPAPFDRELLVIMVGNAKPDGIQGFGEARSLVFDYPRNSDKGDAFLLMTVAHEQFHQLRALSTASTGQFFQASAAWLEEGLAEYYGLKIVMGSKRSYDEKSKVWNAFVDIQRPIENGLKKLNARYKQGDQSVYPLFYTQGATFFSEIDQALIRASKGKVSLDAYVTRLAATTDGDIDPGIVNEWRGIAGRKIDALIARYVGSS